MLSNPPNALDVASPPTRMRAGLQLGYGILFAGLFVVPNLLRAPSLTLIVVAFLALVWLAGCVAELRSLPRADELMLCGSFAPVLVGIWTAVFRIHFLWTHRALSHPSIPGSSASGFIAAWLLETVLLLLPGAVFLATNIRSLRPAADARQNHAASGSRPRSRKRRT